MEIQRSWGRLQLAEFGAAGPAVVLLHGILAGGEVWRAVAAGLARGHRVIVPDLPGFGRSDRPAGPYQPDWYVAELLALLDALGLDRPSLVGWSMGGAIAMRFAAQHPDRLDRLVLLDTTPCLIAQPDFPDAVPPQAAADLGALLARDYPAGAAAFVDLVLHTPAAPPDPAARALLLDLAGQTTEQVALACFGNFGASDSRPALAHIRAPTLVVCGEHDAVCPPGASAHLARHIAGARLSLLPGAGHAPMLTHPADLLALLEDALRT